MAAANVTVDLKLNEVIDNLADKLGVATSKLQPLAKEGFDQYVLRETIEAGICFFLFAVFVVFCFIGFKTAKNAPPVDNDLDINGLLVFGVVTLILSFIGVCITLGLGITSLSHAVAPLPSLLGL